MRGSTAASDLDSVALTHERWREGFLRIVLWGACALGLAAAVVSVADSVRNGQIALVWTYGAAWVLLLAAAALRLPYRLRAGVFLALIYALGVSGLVENGMRGDARMFFLAASLMTALLFDPAAGFAVMGLSLLTIGGLAPFAITGRFRLLSKVTVAGDLGLWLSSTLDLLAVGTALLIGLTLFLREFGSARERIRAVVTDLERERSHLRESEERYRSIFHRSPVSLWEQDISGLRAELRTLRAHGVTDMARYLEENPGFVARAVRSIVVLDVNDATLRLYGVEERDELLGPLDATLEPSALADFRDQIIAISEGRSRFERESTARTPGGETLHILTSCSIPAPEDEHQRMLVNVFDIGERKRAEVRRLALEEELHRAQRMESIGRFAGSIAHDVNNLLSPILGCAQMLLEDSGPSDPRREDLQQIAGAATRARDLTRQLLAFGRKQDLQLRVVDLREVLDGFMKILRRSIREDIRIETRVGERPSWVMADTGQIEQVLMNLAVNAQDAMEGGGSLLISLAEDSQSSEVLLRVTDSGHGMDRATRERIFEPFFTTKKPGKGTGLGLATVYGIVAQHGGIIGVDSEPGRGCTFTLRLPRAEGRAAVPESP
jgi:signal transduction histidine kinase